MQRGRHLLRKLSASTAPVSKARLLAPVNAVFKGSVGGWNHERCVVTRRMSTSSDPASADKTLLEMMVASAHWKVDGGFLTKQYEFRDEKTVKVFSARSSDLWPKLCCPPQDLSVTSPTTISVTVKDSSGVAAEETAFDRQPTAVEVDIALAIDDVAAELQLGGRWN